jgi:transposase
MATLGGWYRDEVVRVDLERHSAKRPALCRRTTSKPNVKRGKNDAAAAAAFCEAVTRPTMRFVAIKRQEQQAALVMHRARVLLVQQRTQPPTSARALSGWRARPPVA